MITLKSGKIHYSISVVIPEGAPENPDYSPRLYRQILEYNIRRERTVSFNGTQSKTEEVTTDYGFKSPACIIRNAGKNEYVYCKAFPYINAFFTIKDKFPDNGEYAPPRVILYDEYKNIAGYKCRKARIDKTGIIYRIWFTGEIKIKDLTQAVIQHENIDGLVMEQEEIPDAKKVHFYKKYTVIAIEDKALAKEAFDIPQGYKQFNNIDEVRKENRRMLDKKSEEDLQNNRSVKAEVLPGTWLFDNGEDKLLLIVNRQSKPEETENTFEVISINLSRKAFDPKNFLSQKAVLKGRYLLVEEAPNYKLYQYNAGENKMELVGNEVFSYRKLSNKEVRDIKERYKLAWLNDTF